MNVLIVDDQPSIVASLLTGIPWRTMGVENTFSATSSLAAKEILLKNNIDIVLTDIEMPVENGIALLSWIREQGMNIECIFLTSHPDFFYAKQAITLGVVDYVLQPAKNEDIIRAVENAQLRIMKAQRMIDLKTNRFTSAAQNTVLRDFFECWPDGTKSEGGFTLDNKLMALKDMGISCEKKASVFLLWTEIVRWSKIPSDAADFIGSFQRQLDRVLSFVNLDSVSYYIDDGHVCSVIFGPLSDEVVPYIRIFQENLTGELGMHTHISVCGMAVEELKRGLDFLSAPERSENAAWETVRDNRIQMLTLPSDRDEFAALNGSEKYRYYYQQILEYIRQNLDKPLTRHHIAEHLFLSPDYVNFIVKSCIGWSCTDLIIRVKMSYAKQLLEATDMPVGEVAVSAGYTSFAYFSKVYKGIYKKTPSETRRGGGKMERGIRAAVNAAPARGRAA